jgi:uncharacterized protein
LLTGSTFFDLPFLLLPAPRGFLMNANLLSAAQALGGGVLIGFASWLLLASLGRVAGISSITASFLRPVPSERGAAGHWRWAFLVGLIGGGAAFSPWLQPAALSVRPVALLLVAGLLVGVGTVLGSGCTSGHGVCGLGRRSGRSLLATLTFMAFGGATVAAAYVFVGRAII